MGGMGASADDIRTVTRLSVELLPRLAPDNPRLRFIAAEMARCISPGPGATTCYLTMLSAALDVARRQGSDLFTARCDYRMAVELEDWVVESAV